MFHRVNDARKFLYFSLFFLSSFCIAGLLAWYFSNTWDLSTRQENTQSQKKFIVACNVRAFDKLRSNKPFSSFSFVILWVTLLIAHISIPVNSFLYLIFGADTTNQPTNPMLLWCLLPSVAVSRCTECSHLISLSNLPLFQTSDLSSPETLASWGERSWRPS